MEPRIQYAKTKDGVSIAFWTLGEGDPLVVMPVLFASIETEWRLPGVRRWYERLAGRWKLLRYDRRGTGLSDRDVTDFSMEPQILDLEAVLDHCGLERVALFARFVAGPVAITYAVRRPERVSHLILWLTHVRGSEYLASPQVRAWSALIDKDWEFFSESMAQFAGGWSSGAVAREHAASIREGITPQTLQTSLAAVAQFDVTSLLPQVAVPALVLHRRHVSYSPADAAKELASGIPTARLVVDEGTSLAPVDEDADLLMSALDEFLSEGETRAEPERELPQGTAVILFADIADSTGLTERLGDEAFREQARALDGALREVILGASGTPIEGKLLGDGVLAVFTSARQAIEAALRCAEAGSRGGLPLHLGVHAGDVIREDDGNVYGGAVNIAARIADASAPGEVLVSQTVRDLARTSAGVAFEDRGQRKLKGVEGRQRLFAVRERGDA